MIGSITSTGTGYFSDGTPIYTRVQPEQFHREKYSENTETSETPKTQPKTEPKISGLEKFLPSDDPKVNAILDHLAGLLVEFYSVISNYNCANHSATLMETPEFKNANKKVWEILSRTDLNGYLDSYRETYNNIMEEAKVVHQNSLTKKNRGKSKKNGQKIVYSS